MLASTFILGYNFIQKKRKYTCVNCTLADVSDITPESVNIELKDNLIKIEGINTLLREEKQKLKEENAIIKNSNKVNKENNINKINELETQVKHLQKSLTEANRKNAEKNKEIHKLERQPQLHKVLESRQMAEDDIDFRAENNSNLNWELGVCDGFRDFKRFVAMEFQEIKQQMAEIASDKNKHPASRNNGTFLNTKLTRKPGYIKQGTLTKDNETKKQKGRSFAAINKYPERDMLFQIRPGAATYNQAVQQKKKMGKICNSMPKSINLSEIKRKLGKTFTVKLSSE